jgi:chemotaxis protein histidine kinase CheA
MADPQADLAERLARLRHSYISHLPAKIGDIEAAWQSLMHNAWEKRLIAEMHRMTHSLTGSGKTFGVDAVSGAARSLEMRLKAVTAADARPSEPELVRISELVQHLRYAVDHVAEK